MFDRSPGGWASAGDTTHDASPESSKILLTCLVCPAYALAWRQKPEGRTSCTPSFNPKKGLFSDKKIPPERAEFIFQCSSYEDPRASVSDLSPRHDTMHAQCACLAAG